ncbi:MAG: UPF0280 family protein [Butyricicoccus sp.]
MEQSIDTLPDGRVLIDYGPVTMVLLTEADGCPQPALCRAFFPQLQTILAALHDDLSRLRRPPAEIDASRLSPFGQTMLAAVRAADDPTLTPMAAVAGTIADAAADWLWQVQPERVLVNNGGDIALRLADGQQARVGIMSSLVGRKIDRIVTLRAENGVGGICTSGLGGRSLTRGIADAVTVFASTAAQADALATHLANTTFVPAPGVQTMPARTIDPATDIPDLTVVTHVPPLDQTARRQALAAFTRRAAVLQPHFRAAYAYVQGDTVSSSAGWLP